MTTNFIFRLVQAMNRNLTTSKINRSETFLGDQKKSIFDFYYFDVFSDFLY